MTKPTVWILSIITIFVSAHAYSTVTDWRDTRKAEYADQWEQTARTCYEVIGKYQTAMQSCSYVVGQHIQILNHVRDTELQPVCYKTAYGDYALARQRAGTIEEKYKYYFENLDRETPALSKRYAEAREAAKDVVLPFFIER